MVLDNYRTTLNWWLVPLAKGLRTVHPDVFTWLSLVMALAAGAFFLLSTASATGLGLLMVAFVCVGLNSILDLLDGQVAKMTGRTSARGDYLDHSIDRFSDTAILAGIGLSPWCRTSIGLAAVGATLLASYMGTQAQAVGLKRHYGGLLGRADRMVLLLAAPLAQAAYSAWKGAAGFTLAGHATTILELTMAYFAVMGLVTVVQRFVSGLRAFGPDGHLKP